MVDLSGVITYNKPIEENLATFSALMIFLFWRTETMLIEFIRGYGLLLAYFVIAVIAALAIRRLTIPKEVYRKTLHMILLCSVFVWYMHLIPGGYQLSEQLFLF